MKSDGYYKLGGTYGPINTISAFTDGHPFTYHGLTGTSGDGQPNKDAGGEDVVNGRVKADGTRTKTASARPVRSHARSFGFGAGIQRYAGGRAVPLELPRLHAAHGDPLDHMGATNRNDSLLKMGEGQIIDVDGYYLNLEWDVGPGTLFAIAGKRDQDEHLPNTYPGSAPVNYGHG